MADESRVGDPGSYKPGNVGGKDTTVAIKFGANVDDLKAAVKVWDDLTKAIKGATEAGSKVGGATGTGTGGGGSYSPGNIGNSGVGGQPVGTQSGGGFARAFAGSLAGAVGMTGSYITQHLPEGMSNQQVYTDVASFARGGATKANVTSIRNLTNNLPGGWGGVDANRVLTASAQYSGQVPGSPAFAAYARNIAGMANLMPGLGAAGAVAGAQAAVQPGRIQFQMGTGLHPSLNDPYAAMREYAGSTAAKLRAIQDPNRRAQVLAMSGRPSDYNMRYITQAFGEENASYVRKMQEARMNGYTDQQLTQAMQNPTGKLGKAMGLDTVTVHAQGASRSTAEAQNEGFAKAAQGLSTGFDLNRKAMEDLTTAIQHMPDALANAIGTAAVVGGGPVGHVVSGAESIAKDFMKYKLLKNVLQRGGKTGGTVLKDAEEAAPEAAKIGRRWLPKIFSKAGAKTGAKFLGLGTGITEALAFMDLVGVPMARAAAGHPDSSGRIGPPDQSGRRDVTEVGGADTGATGSTAPIQGPPSGSEIVKFALTLVGKPYHFGSEGPTSFDCSGLTAYVYAHFKVALPHRAAAQFQMGQAVSLSQVEPGDLLFFGSGSRATHVAIAKDQGTMIHAPHAGANVQVAGWSSNIIGARRYLKAGAGTTATTARTTAYGASTSGASTEDARTGKTITTTDYVSSGMAMRGRFGDITLPGSGFYESGAAALLDPNANAAAASTAGAAAAGVGTNNLATPDSGERGMTTARPDKYGWGPLGSLAYEQSQQGIFKLASGQSFTANKRIGPLMAMLGDATQRRGYNIKSFNPFQYRNVKGTSTPSLHAWGLAVDVNGAANPMQSKFQTDMPDWMPKMWNRYNFEWGGVWNRPDTMHYEYSASPAQAVSDAAKASSELKQYAKGAWEVVGDEIAQLHSGEMVLPRGTARKVRSLAAGTAGGGGAVINITMPVQVTSQMSDGDIDLMLKRVSQRLQRETTQQTLVSR